MNRYARQTSLPEIGEAGQEKLRNAKVLIVGVGGLGSPIALYLAGAGVGTLGLVDDDQVSISNLQRQVLYAEADLGQPKPLCGARRVQGLNSDVNVEVYPFRLDKKNAGELIRNYVYGAIQGFEGQVSVFCYGESAKNYRDLYPDEEGTLLMPSLDKSVIGVTPAIVGSVEANEVLKLICGYGEPLAGKLWTIDLRTMQSYILSL